MNENKLFQIKKIWVAANEAQEVDYVGNGDWIEKLDAAITILDEAAAEFPQPKKESEVGGEGEEYAVEQYDVEEVKAWQKKWLGEKSA